MARLNSGVLALGKEWQDPSELIRLTLQRLKGPLQGRELDLQLEDELPLLHIDYRLIEHALSNLLLNAAVYAPQGKIRVGAKRAGEELEILVSDQGPGIPDESLGRIFEKFYRVPGSPAGGTGLGLFITRSLVRAHGGEVRVRNREEGGAEFSIHLPLEALPSMPTEAKA
jgi:two-component system sensor histidine kinase KdpD